MRCKDVHSWKASQKSVAINVLHVLDEQCLAKLRQQTRSVRGPRIMFIIANLLYISGRKDKDVICAAQLGISGDDMLLLLYTVSGCFSWRLRG